MAGSRRGQDRRRAVVVGGGPGGLVAALCLAQTGWSVLVLERRSGPDRTGAGIALQPNGLAVLDALDLAEPLLDAGHGVRSLALVAADGRVLHDITPPPFVGSTAAVAVHRQVLAEVLAGAATNHPGVEVRYGAAVDGADRRGTVTVRADGVDTAAELRADLVVGADGVGSQVRRSGSFGPRPITARHRYARWVVDAPTGLRAGECWTGSGLLGWADIGAGRSYWYASLRDPSVVAAVETGDRDRFVDHWRTQVPYASSGLDLLPDLEGLLVNDAPRVRCRRWVDGRVALLGDAAHAMAPNLGQGANSAFLDAAALALALRDASDPPGVATAADDDGIDRALARYQRERRASVTRVQRTADLLAQVSHLRPPVVRRARDAAVRVVARPWLLDRQVRAAFQVDPHRLRAELAEAFLGDGTAHADQPSSAATS